LFHSALKKGMIFMTSFPARRGEINRGLDCRRLFAAGFRFGADSEGPGSAASAAAPQDGKGASASPLAGVPRFPKEGLNGPSVFTFNAEKISFALLPGDFIPLERGDIYDQLPELPPAN
jgi:hypothetical protein